MTSHGVGICWCHSFSVLKSRLNCSGLAERTSKRILVCPKDAARFEDVVAAKTCWVNGVSQDGTCSLGKMVRPARRTSVEKFCVASWQVVSTTVSCHPPIDSLSLRLARRGRFSNTLVMRMYGKYTLTFWIGGRLAFCFWRWMTTNEEMESACLLFRLIGARS